MSSSKYVLALDQGTTSSRAIVFGHDGRAVAAAQQEFPQILPSPGVVEHDAEVIWSTQLAVARQAISNAGLSAADIAAIGVANQRETTVLWDRMTSKPVANAVVWQSRVSAPICEELVQRGLEPTYRSKTGLLLDAYFSGTKIKHLLDTIPELRNRAERGEIAFGTIDSWLIWKLSGGQLHLTDTSNASRTLLFNIHSLSWDDELLGHLDIPRSLLPEVRSSSEIYGETSAEIFGQSIPISGCAGDQQAATFGQACFEIGSAKNTYGTGCFMLLNTGTQPVASQNRLLTTVGWTIGGKTTYCLEGSVFVAGAAVQWLRDGLGIIANSSEIESLATTVVDSAGVIFVPALVGMGAPYWDSQARGTIVGITRGTTAAHLARATLDAMAFQSRDLVEAMERDSRITLKKLRVDGGACVNNLLMQFQADILGVPVHRPLVSETTALGAAYLAGLAVGYWQGLDDITHNWQLEREFTPVRNMSDSDKLYATWRRAVERSLKWAE